MIQATYEPWNVDFFSHMMESSYVHVLAGETFGTKITKLARTSRAVNTMMVLAQGWKNIKNSDAQLHSKLT